MLAVRGIDHAYAGRAPVTVLDGVDLTVEPGEFVSIVGPSGCGKTTLLRIIAGLELPDAGTVELDGVSAVGRPGTSAYMPQHDLLLPWRRALDNAVLAAEIDGTPRDESRGRALDLVERFGLSGFEEAWPSELSGGMRQRLALLRTFLFDRDLLLLDEPFGALDAITRRDMHAWLQGVLAADRRSVLFVTHDVEEALVLSDRVVVMSARPGHLTATIDVPMPRPRAAEVVLRPELIGLKAQLLDALEAARSPAGGASCGATEPAPDRLGPCTSSRPS